MEQNPNVINENTAVKSENEKKFPVWTSLSLSAIIIGVVLLLLNFSDKLTSLIPGLDGMNDYTPHFVNELIYSLVLLAGILIFKYTKGFKSRKHGFSSVVFTGGFLVCYFSLTLVSQLIISLVLERTPAPWYSMLSFSALMFLIGFFEEGVFRGVILNLFLDSFPKNRFGIWAAVVLEGLLFGALHLQNAIGGEVHLDSVIIQALTAAALGITISACYLRTGSFLLVVVAHAMIDFASLMGGGIFTDGNLTENINQMSAVNLIVVPIMLIPAIILLRGSKVDEIIGERRGETVIHTEKEAQNIGIVSLILGIIGCAGFLFYGYLIGFAVTGLCGSIYSKKLKPQDNTVAVTGIVFSALGIGACVLGFGIILFLLSIPSFHDSLKEGIQQVLESRAFLFAR